VLLTPGKGSVASMFGVKQNTTVTGMTTKQCNISG
jgi:hypothetical protein